MTHEPVPPRNLTRGAAASRRAPAALPARRNVSPNAAQRARVSAPCRGVALRQSWNVPPGPSRAAETVPSSPGSGRSDGGQDGTAVPPGSAARGHPVGAAAGSSGGNACPVGRPGRATATTVPAAAMAASAARTYPLRRPAAVVMVSPFVAPGRAGGHELVLWRWRLDVAVAVAGTAVVVGVLVAAVALRNGIGGLGRRCGGRCGWRADRGVRRPGMVVVRGGRLGRRGYLEPESAGRVEAVALGLAGGGVPEVGVEGMPVIGGLDCAV